MPRRRDAAGVSWKKVLAGTVFGVVVVVSIYMFVIPLLMPVPGGPLPVYNGEYSDLLRSAAASHIDPDNPVIIRTARYILLDYWRRHYNPVLYNKSVVLHNGTSVSIPFHISGGGSLHVNISANGTYYYRVALDVAGRYPIRDIPWLTGNTTIDFPENMGYMELYFLVTTDNSTVVAHILLTKTYNSTIPLQRTHGYVWVIWMFDTWIHHEFNITPSDGLASIAEARKPWEILGENATEITDQEAVFLLANFYLLYDLDTRLLVLDRDGDGVGDHVSLIVKYPGGTGDDYVHDLDKLYVDLGISGDPTIPDSLYAKQLVYGGDTWLIIDPGLEKHPYVPSMMQLDMKPLGTIPLPGKEGG